VMKNISRIFIMVFIISLFSFTLYLAYLTIFPRYTIILRIRTTVWAYRIQAERAGAGHFEDPLIVSRHMSTFNGFYPVKDEWKVQKKYEPQEKYETHSAEFVLLVSLISETRLINWSSPLLTVDEPGTYIATIEVTLSNLEPNRYLLEVILLQRGERVDSFTECLVIP